MSSNFSIKSNTTFSLKSDIEKILRFVCESCAVEDGFITMIISGKHVIQSKVGLDNLLDPYDVTGFKQLLHLEMPELQINHYNNSFEFFAGFSIHIADSTIAGTLCIFNKKRKALSSLELKTITHSVHQIQSVLQLYNKNESLQSIIKQNEVKVIQDKLLTTQMLNNLSVGIVVVGLQSTIVENNLAACEILGIDQSQFKDEFFRPADWKGISTSGQIFKLNDYRVSQTFKAIDNVTLGVFRPAKSDLVWLAIDAVPVYADNGKISYVIWCFSKVSKLESEKSTLEVGIERFFYACMATSDIIWDWDIKSNKVVLVNGNNSPSAHYVSENIYDFNELNELIHIEDRFFISQSIQVFIDGEESKWSNEYRYQKPDGTYAHVKDNAIVIRNDVGKAIRVIGAAKDVSNEKELGDKLLQSEQQFKGVFEHSAVGMAIVDLQGSWLVVNPRIVEILGYSAAEFYKMSFMDMTHPDDLDNDLNELKKLNAGVMRSYNMEKRCIRKDGLIVWVNLTVSLVKNALGEPMHYVSQFIDITLRKATELEDKLKSDRNSVETSLKLNEVKDLYRLLADNMVDVVCLHNLDTLFQYVSPSITSILGYYSEDLIGTCPFDLLHPDDYTDVKEHILYLLTETKHAEMEVRYRNKKGCYVWCVTKLKVISKNGAPVNVQSFTRDITKEKEASIAIRNALLKEREVNELRNNLVSTISHEFRTPMTTILSCADLIQMYLEKKNIENVSFVKERVKIITGEIGRIVDLMDSVLVVSKNELGKTNFHPVYFDLKEFFLETIQKKGFYKIGRRNLKTSFKGDTFPVFADKKLMEYIIINILKNAFKYSHRSTDVTMNVLIADNKIYIEIIDFGIGIPEDELENVFDIFFRARNTNDYNGTGLGLYIVKTFIESNSGSVKIESKIGKGTTVVVCFPLLIGNLN